MKKIILFSLLLLLSAATFSQPSTTVISPAKTDYLKKSKQLQKTATIVLLSGPVLIATSLLVVPHINIGGMGLFYGTLLAGLACIPVSIGLFIAASPSQKKAMNTSAYFKMEEAQQFQGSSFITKPVPSLTLKISL